jgi:hypothetical protein
MTSKLFEKLIEIKPVFFHWMDGYISKNAGNSREYTNTFIINKMAQIIDKRNITISIFGKIKIDKRDKPLLTCYIFNNKDNKPEQGNMHMSINMESETSKIAFVGLDKSNQYKIRDYKHFEDRRAELLKFFNFNILQTGDENHAICLVTFIEDGKIYISIVNSGENINENDSITNENKTKTYFSPHRTFIVCNDITNDNQFFDGFKTIFAMYHFEHVYKLLNKLAFTDLLYIDDKPMYKLEPDCVELLKFIIKYCNGASSIKFGNTTLGLIANKPLIRWVKKNKMSTNQYYTITNITNEDTDSGYLFTKEEIGIFKDTYYLILSKFLSSKEQSI